MVEHLLCKQAIAVRFCSAPNRYAKPNGTHGYVYVFAHGLLHNVQNLLFKANLGPYKPTVAVNHKISKRHCG